MIVQKGTEPPFSGEYDDFYEEGIFVCRRCNAPLFSSKAKFDAGCGWPAFDEHFPRAVTWSPDADGQRTEITCSTCGAHLGIVFKGEQLTEKTLGIVLIHCRFGFKKSEKTEQSVIRNDVSLSEELSHSFTALLRVARRKLRTFCVGDISYGLIQLSASNVKLSSASLKSVGVGRI